MTVSGSREGIYAVVRRIPSGRVATYGQVARLAGMVGHARQVGYALNDLPAGTSVPWHRVINAAGRVSRRSEPLDEEIQRRLLASEGVVFDARGRVAPSRFLWSPLGRRAPGSRSRASVSSGRAPRPVETVGYERAPGLRETASGFSVIGSRTLAVPISALYRAWEDGRVRSRWLPHAPLSIGKATRNKSMHITWSRPDSSLEVTFNAKGNAKVQVTVQHSKLASAQAAARMRAHWARSLDRLKGLLER